MARKVSKKKRKNIAIEINANIPYNILTDIHRISYDTVNKISDDRKKLTSPWMGEEDIVDDPDQRFLYAQRVYTQDDLPEDVQYALREHVFKHVLLLATRGFSQVPYTSLFRALNYSFPPPNDGHVERLKSMGLELWKGHVRVYNPFITGYFAEEFVRDELYERKDDALTEEQIEKVAEIDKIVEDAYSYFDKKKKRIMERRFGLHGYREHSVNQVVTQLEMERKFVIAHENEALKTMRLLMRLSNIEKLLQGLA